MKKIININFQGRVIPIEEPAYEVLKQYIESLKAYFAAEDGRDEIINDIESRIAELFYDRIKRGANCIVDEDVHAVIANIGKPEELEAAEAEDATVRPATGRTNSETNTPPFQRGRFVRNEDDKILGGVCSGLAAYLSVDPVIVRILFVILGGALFWVYILLWLIVPSTSVRTNVTKRLYRNPDDKVIAGVCGGLAAYFHIDTWIPRLIFALPFVLGLATGGFHALMWDWWGIGPRVFTGSVGSSLFIAYIILWIAVPYAMSAAEKLEMRGEKVNLDSIRNTIKDDLEGFKTRAEGWGRDVQDSARNLSGKAKEFASDPSFRRTGSGLGHVIAVLFKAFFLFIAGSIALTLFGVLIALLFGGIALFPMKDFVFDGWEENALALCAIVLVLAVPLIGLITWLVRRLTGAHRRNHYLGTIFTGLWVIGFIAAITLAAMIIGEFRSKSSIEETQAITQPSSGKVYIGLSDDHTVRMNHYHREWFGSWDDDGMPIYGANRDSLMLNTVRVDIAKSNDSLFHIYKVKFSRAGNINRAKVLASRVRFDINQYDSLISLPRGFTISKKDKFRNQQVLVIVEVPVGKRIQVDRSVDDYDWFNINVRRRNSLEVEWNDDEDFDDYKTGKEYIMTPSGLQRTDRIKDEEEDEDDNNSTTPADTTALM